MAKETKVYDIKPTEYPLTEKELFVGRTVCFKDVETNPNNIGTLVKAEPNNKHEAWIVTINNVRYAYDVNNYRLPEGYLNYNPNDITARLYGIKTDINLNLSNSSTVTRGEGSEETSTTLTSLIAKDQFAIAAMQSILSSIQNLLSIDDATIMAVAVKSYKIAQAMLSVGTLARKEDEKSDFTQSTVEIDKANLSDNVEKLLYNLCEAIKDNTKNNKENGIIVKTDEPIEVKSTIQGTPTVKIDGTPEVKVVNTPDVNVSNTPDVNCANMISTPVSVTGTINVGNFPKDSE